jgi:transcription elongation factor GreA-like protein
VTITGVSFGDIVEYGTIIPTMTIQVQVGEVVHELDFKYNTTLSYNENFHIFILDVDGTDADIATRQGILKNLKEGYRDETYQGEDYDITFNNWHIQHDEIFVTARTGR